MNEIFSKEKWIEYALKFVEAGFFLQRDFEANLNSWVTEFDGKYRSEIDPENTLNDAWFIVKETEEL